MLKVSKWRHVPNRFAAALWVVVATALAVLSAGPASAAPYNLTSLNVVGPNGEAITGYRWLIQEDTMKASVPGGPAVPGSEARHMLALPCCCARSACAPAYC